MEAKEIIKNLRIKKKLTQEELGVLLGVKKSAVQKYESGAITNFKIETLQKMCIIFDVQPWILVFPESITVDNFDFVIKAYGNENNSDVYNAYIMLNEHGREKVREYIKDLSCNGENLIKSQHEST